MLCFHILLLSICFYWSVYLCVFVSINHVACRCLQSPEESVWFLGTGVTGTEEPPGCWQANLCLASRRAQSALNGWGILPTHIFTFFTLPFALILCFYNGMFEGDNFIKKTKVCADCWSLNGMESGSVYFCLGLCHAVSGDGWQMTVVGREVETTSGHILNKGRERKGEDIRSYPFKTALEYGCGWSLESISWPQWLTNLPLSLASQRPDHFLLCHSENNP